VLLVLVVLAAALLGAAVGWWLAVRRDPLPPPAVQASPGTRTQNEPQPLSALVVEALHQGVVVIDREERAVLVNPAARAMGVLDVDRLAFGELVEVARAVLDGGVWPVTSIELPIGRLGREPIALSVAAVPLPGHDERVDAVALLLADVSEQRRLESVRRDFVANVSHELKTPVGALMLLAEAVQGASDDPEAVARFAERMQREGDRLSTLVRELIELSRVQGADPLPGASTVEVLDIVSEAADRSRLAAERSGIAVAVRVAENLAVRGNEAQLTMAVANLIDNAIAYSPAGTRVAVTASAASDDDARPCVDIAVSDQGIGVADAELDRIFERFYRIDPARSRATGGTGLGLAIVKNIVSNHLGRVIVRSVEGSGSTFTIRLPRVHSDGPSSEVLDGDTVSAALPTTRGTAL
jgi:two-component system, OmpR family, sensor histidine kinase SenX3